MKFRETCSCGAQFLVVLGSESIEDFDLLMTKIREWRKKHVCSSSEPDVQAMGGGSAQVEQPLGFTIEGLDYPARRMDPWEDE